MFRLSLPHQSFCHCVTFRFAADLKKSLITQTIMSALQQLDFYDETAASYSIQKNILSNNGRRKNPNRLPETVLSLIRRILKAVRQISEKTFPLSEIYDLFEMILWMIPKNNQMPFS